MDRKQNKNCMESHSGCNEYHMHSAKYHSVIFLHNSQKNQQIWVKILDPVAEKMLILSA